MLTVLFSFAMFLRNVRIPFLIYTSCHFILFVSAVNAAQWNVGFQKTHIEIQAAYKEIEVAIWYPTTENARDEKVGWATLNIATNAEVKKTVRGLILISHGFSGNFLSHNDTAHFLAQNGYVVVTPTHPDLVGLKSGEPALDPLVFRPGVIRTLINRVKDHPFFKTSLREAGIGMVGFSLGAYTVLNAIGASPDLSGLAEYCSLEKDDELLCSAHARRRISAISTQLSSAADAGVSRAVLLAPAYGPLFSKASFASVEARIKQISAEKDRALSNQFHAGHFEKILGNRAVHTVIEEAGHFIFTAPCSNELRSIVPVICNDNPGIDRLKIHEELNREILEFFDQP